MHANGIITGFVIEYYQVGSSYPSRKKEFSPGERQGTIMNLIPGARYVFQIRAKTQVGDGQVLDVEQEMPIWRPPKPDRNTIATELDHTMTTVTIQFRKGYFEDTHGKVKNYAIIVTEDDTKRTDQKQKLYTWYDVQKMRVWVPYQASDPYYPFNNSREVEDFVVGNEKCENKVSVVDKWRMSNCVALNHSIF